MVPDQVSVGLDDLVEEVLVLLGQRVLPELRALLAEFGVLVAEEGADVDHVWELRLGGLVCHFWGVSWLFWWL